MKRIFIIFLTLLLAAALLSPAALAEGEEPPEIVDPCRLYTYEQLTADLAALAERYPELASVSSIGKSVEGREIPLLSLGKGERTILVCAAMHAREYETTNVVMCIAERYCRAYEQADWYCGMSCRALLDGVRFLIVPVLNPDGVVIAQQGTEYALANPALAAMPITDGWPGNYYCWKANANGVDLNHNWPYYFDNSKKSLVPSSADYAGPEPLSEPETRAMYELIRQTPYYAFCSFHSAGNCIYWIDSSNPQELRDKLYPTASRIAQFCGYRLMLNEDISRSGGYMINYARATSEKPCITVEICTYTGQYPFQNYFGLRATIEKAYPIGYLLADEVLKMPEEDGAKTPSAEGPVSSEEPSEAAPITEDAAPGEAASPPAEETGTAEEATAETEDAAPQGTEREETPAAEPMEAAAETGIRVTLDGAEIEFPDVRPVIENDRVLTPMRAACEAAQLSVGWDDGVVTVTDGERVVRLTIGAPFIEIDGREYALDSPAVLRGDRTMIPIRVVMEHFGYAVDWDGATRTVCITSEEQN